MGTRASALPGSAGENIIPSDRAPTVYAFADYRAFVRDWLAAKRAVNPRFSQRLACRRIGLKSPGHLSQILAGKANISLDLAERISEFLGLKPKEAEYFRCLVLFTQAATHSDRKAAFTKLIKLKLPDVKVLQQDQFEFYEKWYYTAVREVLSIHRFRGDYQALARTVLPNITPKEAEKAIALLERLGFIARNAQGVYEQTGRAISSGYGMRSLSLDTFVVNSLELARNALDSTPGAERNLSWATFTVSQPTFHQIEEELRAFRRRIQQLANADQAPDRAYQINFQLFPISAAPAPARPA